MQRETVPQPPQPLSLGSGLLGLILTTLALVEQRTLRLETLTGSGRTSRAFLGTSL
ncbi:MAG: hypothetical protein KAX64_06975 [Chromatiaceae bacterium]|nr:hypothetical protein [Chromatiaceae bacterium]